MVQLSIYKKSTQGVNMSSRRDFLKLTAAAAAGCFLPACSNAQNSSTPKPEKPNIIFLLADDLGYADLSSTGSDLHQTPNLDKLKSESMWFSDAYSCHSTCAPSRLGYMTGKYPARLGVVNNHVGGALKGRYTLAQAMKENGYQTCHIGKWHIGNGDQRPELRGFDKSIGSNLSGMPASYHYPFGKKAPKQSPTSKNFQTVISSPTALPKKLWDTLRNTKTNPSS
jgi:arylsulfatase A-like enzyme